MGNIFVSSDRLHAPIKAEADGNNTVIAGVANKRIAVTGYNLTTDVTGTITLQDDADTPVLLGALHLSAGNPAPYADVYDPAFILSPGASFVINNPSGVNTYGHLNYILL